MIVFDRGSEMDTRVKERIDDFTGERTELEIWSSRETGRVRSDSGKRDVQRRFRVGEILRGSTSRQPTMTAARTAPASRPPPASG